MLDFKKISLASLTNWLISGAWDLNHIFHTGTKVECVLPMVIWSEFRLGQYRDDEHQLDAPHFILTGSF